MSDSYPTDPLTLVLSPPPQQGRGRRRGKTARAEVPSLPTENDLGPLPDEPLAEDGAHEPLVVDLETRSVDELWPPPPERL